MARNDRDVWPDDVPIGTFSIELGGVQGYPAATAHIQFVCPNRQRCAILIGPAHVNRPTPDALPIWGWNGDRDRPTLIPSIDCSRVCGWHGHIVDGELR